MNLRFRGIGNKNNEQQSSDDEPSPSEFTFYPLYAQSLDEEHQSYADTLNKALEDERIKNIALTGGYGAGKSSILDAFEQDKKERIIRVSFSSLGAKIEDKIVDADDSSDGETGAILNLTNLIQKEIVKQILFKEAPRNLPSSKFRRISKTYVRSFIYPSLFFAVILELVLFMLGRLDFVMYLVNDNIFLYILSLLFMLSITTLIFTVLSAIVGSSVRLEKITGGPLTLGLTGTNNYFDEYLDEILYFFETTKYDIVLVEDIDRFKKLYIFESLRQLSAIINSSGQVGKSVRFIYALKDSIFANGTDVHSKMKIEEPPSKKIPTDDIKPLPKDLEQAANRTKFFDLIIPIVPFLAHNTSRNYVSDELKRRGLSVSPAVIKLVASELTDMRLIKNIANEFYIFNQKVLVESRIKSLKPDNMFAMTVYKNLFLGDFENIKTGKSLLNQVLKKSNSFVRNEVKSLLEQQDSLVDEREKALGLHRRIEKWSAQLVTYLDGIASGFNSTIIGYEYNSRSIEKDYFSDIEFWREITNSQDAVSIVIKMRDKSTNVRSSYSLTKENLQKTVINRTIELDDLNERDSEKISSRISQINRDINVLQRMSISELMKKYRSTFRKDINNLISNEMVSGLLEAGFIDRYFALYTSTYHPGNLSGNAMNFMIHNIDSHSVDVTYPFQEQSDIENLLRDLSSAELYNPALINIDVLNYLLGFKNSSRMPIIARTIAEHEARDELLDSYVRQGKYPTKLIRFMAPLMPSVFRYLFTSKAIKGKQKWDMVNEAIAFASKDLDYYFDEYIKKSIVDNTNLLRATKSEDTKLIANLVHLVDTAGIRFKSLIRFSQSAVKSVATGYMFDVNASNLRTVLGDKTKLSLNEIRQTDKPLYDFVIENIDDYVSQLEQKKIKYALNNGDVAVEVLTDVAKSNSDVIATVIGAVDASAVLIDDISILPKDTWTALFENSLVSATLKNALSYYVYLHAPGEALYKDLAEFVEDSNGELTVEGGLSDYEQDDLKNFITACLNSSLLTKPTKAAILEGCFDGSIDAEFLVFDNTTPIKELLSSNTIADTVVSFSFVTKGSWPAIEEFLKNASGVTEYIGEVDFTTELLRKIVSSDKMPSAIKGYIVKHLEDYADILDKDGAEALLRFTIDGKWHLSIAHQLILYKKTNNQSYRTKLFISSKKNINSISDAQELLKAMDTPYNKLAQKGTLRKFEDTEENRNLFNNLDELGMISKVIPDKTPGSLRVTTKRKW